MSKKYKMICIVGESCSGKDTYVRMIEEMSMCDVNGVLLKPVVSFTTRPKRNHELNGIEHYFISEERADELLSSETIIAYTKMEDPTKKAKGYRYFTTFEHLNKSNMYIIDPAGIKYLTEHLNDKFELFIVYIHTPKFIRNLRARKRSDYKTEFKNRVLNEEKQFREFKLNKSYDYKMENIFGFRFLHARLLYKRLQKFMKEGK